VHILVVDDDAGSRAGVARLLEVLGHQVTTFDKAKEALSVIRALNFPLVFSEIRMPEMSGLDLLREISRLPQDGQPKVVLYTGYGSMDTAIEAFRTGAFDYLVKPIKAGDLEAVLNKIPQNRSEKREHPSKKREKPEKKTVGFIRLGDGETIGVFSLKMQRIIEQALKYHADRFIPVLIQGETGTGKELIARLIHDGGRHTDQPFVDINCAAIQPNLFESEFFGYKAGAYTGGMNEDQKGKFDAAQGGTIFLDEVAEIPLELQAKLLRVVQEREYYRVGGTKKLAVDVRIICATNVDLLQAVEEGKFRRDLYFRLQVGQIMLPPLRERVEDIIPLAANFLAEFAAKKQKNFKTLSEEAGKALLNYDWPGNIRELKNTIERAVFLHDDEILQPDFLESAHFVSSKTPGLVENFDAGLKTRGTLIERHVDRLLQDALHKHNGNKAAAARYLGISRRSLYRMLDRLNTKAL
jgi:DNA-binding NtrC family response regulator